MICQNCQTELKEGAKFCTACGTPVAQEAPAQEATPQYQTPPVQAAPPVQTAPPQQAPYQQGGPVYNNYFAAPKVPVTIGGWIGRSLIPLIPFVGAIIYFIMLFIWAGDKTKEETFNNWAKAQLVVMLIGLILGLIILLIAGAAVGGIAEAFI